jgi:8-oxo-dGTP pyrophosphatase MutT (NUDIX family)
VTDDLHADAVRVLSAWSAPDAEQEALRLDYLAHLAANPDGVWRSCPTAHVTASAVVLDHSGRRTALVLHGRMGRWVQPGGHLEPGDTTLLAAAGREAGEETGLPALSLRDAPLLLSRHPAPCGAAETHLDVQYVATTSPHGVPVVSEESQDVRWFDVDGLPGGLAPGVARSVAAAAAALTRG